MTAPVTRERVAKVLDDQGVGCEFHDDKEIVVGGPEFMIVLWCDEEYFQIGGTWRGANVGAADYDAALDFVTSWNQEHTGRHGVLQKIEKDSWALLTDASLPTIEGLSDEQLANYITFAVSMHIEFVKMAAEEFPHLAPATDLEGS